MSESEWGLDLDLDLDIPASKEWGSELLPVLPAMLAQPKTLQEPMRQEAKHVLD